MYNPEPPDQEWHPAPPIIHHENANTDLSTDNLMEELFQLKLFFPHNSSLCLIDIKRSQKILHRIKILTVAKETLWIKSPTPMSSLAIATALD